MVYYLSNTNKPYLLVLHKRYSAKYFSKFKPFRVEIYVKKLSCLTLLTDG